MNQILIVGSGAGLTPAMLLKMQEIALLHSCTIVEAAEAFKMLGQTSIVTAEELVKLNNVMIQDGRSIYCGDPRHYHPNRVTVKPQKRPHHAKKRRGFNGYNKGFL